MVQGKKQLNSKPKFVDVVNTFRLYNRNKPSAEIAGGLHVYKTYTIPYRSFSFKIKKITIKAQPY